MAEGEDTRTALTVGGILNLFAVVAETLKSNCMQWLCKCYLDKLRGES